MTDPFAAGRVVEGDRVRAIPVGNPESAPDGVGFADGIQRWAVEGHFGLAPVIRGYVAAATLTRTNGSLREVATVHEEFLVVPAGRLTTAQRAALELTGLPILESETADRAHPLVDRFAAMQVIDHRRSAAERRVIDAFLAAHPGRWLVVDGAIGALASRPDAAHVIGLVKSHETQFLDGTDLTVALTLNAGCRSSVFARDQAGRAPVYSWYLRLWPWTEQDLLHGLTRVERRADDTAMAEATPVSRWLLAERAPVAAPDPRWDRLAYPIHHVETFLRARAEGWS